ncbi:6-bladed beta-propeller [Niabella hibiscisoli]|uniref:6-bladed beta-propeller n=1 Tax=Niabella hibiscisoli TaxID=1825928 RepID=UPI001F0CEDFF|nr:6-bladed beta-propeller [Niabella hibiscisoli]MCH5715274.1 6-bladed beta-propeller [Niabella hibiscisoli]
MRILTWLTCLALCPMFVWAQDKALYLNPENALGLKASVIFSEAELIPLETTKASSFNNVQNFLVTPHHFVLLDNIANAVLIFDKQGKFLYKYKKKKFRITGVQYVASKNALFIKALNKNYTIPELKAQQMIEQSVKTDFSKYTSLELLYLDKTSNYRVENLPTPRYALNNIFYLNGYYLSVSSRYNKYLKDTIDYHLDLIKDNKIVKSYFPFINLPKLPPYYSNVDFSINNTLDENSLLIQKQFDNTIYRLTPDSLYLEYKFVFPADQTMTGEFQSTMFRSNIEHNTAVNKNNKVISGLNNLVEHKHLLFFSARAVNYAQKNYLFNTVDNKLYDLGKITTDSVVYNLPPKIFSSITEQDEEYVYTRISSVDLLKEKDKLLAQNKELPSKTKNLLTKLDKFDNAIVIKLKVKPSTAK